MTFQDKSILLTASQAAAMCNVSKRSWLRLQASDKIPACIRISGSVRWRKSDIELWVGWGCPNQSKFESRKKTGYADKSFLLLEQAAIILFNLQAGNYTQEQAEDSSEVLEAILRRHYERGDK